MRNVYSVACRVLFAALVLSPLAAAAATFKTLYTFRSGSDGANPVGALLSVGGILYGTTFGGGTPNLGTVFTFNPATGIETVVHAFGGGTDGAGPQAGLMETNGALYGATLEGGGYGCHRDGCGTVFRLDLVTGKVTVLDTFFGGNSSHGANPWAPLVDLGGALYGTSFGNFFSPADSGTIFRVNLVTGKLRTIHSFGDGSDGANPRSALLNVGGLFYGTTSGGRMSSGGFGTLFKIHPRTGILTVLHVFAGGPGDGAAPLGALIDVGGKLFGTTSAGGTTGNGTVFMFDPITGVETMLHSFAGGSDGALPSAALLNVDGTLYGTTYGPLGPPNYGTGTVFKINRTTGKIATLHYFTGGRDGAGAQAALIDVGGTLYGTTRYAGGSVSGGTVFSVVP